MAYNIKPNDTEQPQAPSGEIAMQVYSIKLKSANLFDTIAQIETGLPMSSFDIFRKKIGLSESALSAIMSIPKRTLTRRKQSGRLSPLESERLVRLARLFDKATEVFGGNEKVAAGWFKEPARALGNKTPLEMAETEIGAQEVNALLVRIEHGVFA